MYNYKSIEGYKDLNDIDKKIVKDFCKEFYKWWETPLNNTPIKASRINKVGEFLNDDGSTYLEEVSYLRIDTLREWYHVQRDLRNEGGVSWY